MDYFTSHAHSNHSACHLISPLVYIIYTKPYCLKDLDLPVSGYFSKVSPTKNLKDNERKYFDFSIKNGETIHQYICRFLKDTLII